MCSSVFLNAMPAGDHFLRILTPYYVDVCLTAQHLAGTTVPPNPLLMENSLVITDRLAVDIDRVERHLPALLGMARLRLVHLG